MLLNIVWTVVFVGVLVHTAQLAVGGAYLASLCSVGIAIGWAWLGYLIRQGRRMQRANAQAWRVHRSMRP